MAKFVTVANLQIRFGSEEEAGRFRRRQCRHGSDTLQGEAVAERGAIGGTVNVNLCV